MGYAAEVRLPWAGVLDATGALVLLKAIIRTGPIAYACAVVRILVEAALGALAAALQEQEKTYTGQKPGWGSQLCGGTGLACSVDDDINLANAFCLTWFTLYIQISSILLQLTFRNDLHLQHRISAEAFQRNLISAF